MIYANLVNRPVFVALKPGARVLLDQETGPVDAVSGHVESAGDDYLRLMVTTIYDGEDVLDGEEALELTLHASVITLVQALGDVEDWDEDDEDEGE